MAFSPVLLIGAGVACLGLLLHIIGLATPNWVEYGPNNAGLFRICLSDICVTFEDYGPLENEYRATQAMVIIGMLCGFVAAGVALLAAVFSFLSKTLPKNILRVCLATGAAAGVLIIIGVIIYAATIKAEISDYGYSFGLCIVGAILIPVGSILAFVGGKDVVE